MQTPIINPTLFRSYRDGEAPFTEKVLNPTSNEYKSVNYLGFYRGSVKSVGHVSSLWFHYRINARAELVMVTAPVTCKDYFMDCFNNKKCTAAKYNETTDGELFQNGTTDVGMFFPSHDRLPMFERGLALLHKYEKANRFKLTQFTTTDMPGMILVQGSGKWKANATVLSMYLSALRLISICPEIKDIDAFSFADISPFTGKKNRDGYEMFPTTYTNEYSWYAFNYKKTQQRNTFLKNDFDKLMSIARDMSSIVYESDKHRPTGYDHEIAYNHGEMGINNATTMAACFHEDPNPTFYVNGRRDKPGFGIAFAKATTPMLGLIISALNTEKK